MDDPLFQVIKSYMLTSVDSSKKKQPYAQLKQISKRYSITTHNFFQLKNKHCVYKFVPQPCPFSITQVSYHIIQNGVRWWWVFLTNPVMVHFSNSENSLFLEDPLGEGCC